MLQTAGEIFQFLIESFQTYSGGNYIWALYPLALLVIFLLAQKKDRKIFLVVLIIEALTVFNPYCVKFLLSIYDFDNRYLRFFWIILFFVTIAYAMVLLIFHFKNLFVRGSILVVCLFSIILLGTPVFWGEDVPSYEMASNWSFTTDEIVQLSAIIHSEEKQDPYVLYDNGLVLAYRQYDPTVSSVMSRYDALYLQGHSLEEFQRSNGYGDTRKSLFSVFYYGDYSIDPQVFYGSLQELHVDYMVSFTPALDDYISNLPMSLLGQTTNYRIWKIN